MNGFERLQPAPLSTLHARRVCLIKPSSLGDVVQTLPVLAAVRRRFARASISWLVNATYAPLLRPISILDDVIPFDRSSYRFGRPSSWAKLVPFLRELRARDFDLAIDLQGLFRSGWMCGVTGAGVRLGLASARELATVFYTDLVDDGPRSRHALDRYWGVAEALGVGQLPKSYPLEISEDERAWALERLDSLPRPRIAFNAGARWQTKRWPVERFAEVARGAHRMVGSGTVLLGGPGEEDLGARLASSLTGPSVDLSGRTNLRQLASVLSVVDALVTNDTGTMHLGAAAGVPVVSVFTCTDPARVAPRGDRDRVVRTDVACRASYLKTCDRMDCLGDLSAPRVLGSLLETLGTNDTHLPILPFDQAA